jgi:hypothetical protein
VDAVSRLMRQSLSAIRGHCCFHLGVFRAARNVCAADGSLF